MDQVVNAISLPLAFVIGIPSVFCVLLAFLVFRSSRRSSRRTVSISLPHNMRWRKICASALVVFTLAALGASFGLGLASQQVSREQVQTMYGKGIDCILVVDLSGSIGTSQRELLLTFSDEIAIRNPQARCSVILFSDSPLEAVASASSLAEVIDMASKNINGETNIFLALLRAHAVWEREGKPPEVPIILLSDLLDGKPGEYLVAARRILEEKGQLVVFWLSKNSGSNKVVAAQAAELRSSGAMVIEAQTEEDIASALLVPMSGSEPNVHRSTPLLSSAIPATLLVAGGLFAAALWIMVGMPRPRWR